MNPLLAGLKDVHPGASPPWWPPAPGWWLLATGLLVASLALGWWLRRRRLRREAILRLFDQAVATAETPAGKVAAISELLRRAARRKDPAADKLDGEAWLRFLDAGMPQPVFAQGAGALLRDGPFRPGVRAEDVEALGAVARLRYVSWMRGA